MTVQICGGGGVQKYILEEVWIDLEPQLIDLANTKNDYKLVDCPDVELKFDAVETERHPQTQNV